ncbi:NUDIX domain-containing protein [Nocardiopsis composta]|uniref:8-oxo-dGTP pyrophosphatase MutT (NUDIX family) n=1 Tax=Nocardiopsis composta TaxID=157465 RepID=A0A7W8VGQ0_9ACTN|nr:NUDIX hydrolase [Nocardiopsis composta]MBB5435189.1 8-oxo-dGTP pyrophosphatase MutT (NUDIX family) [Nocardiopsis composta]
MHETQQPVYLWHEAVQPPEGMQVRQVYGYIFDALGRTVVLCDDGRWNLPGGTPEPEDADREATLSREVWEEVQVEIADPVYLGFQEVRRAGSEPYAQLRMAARLSRLGPRAADPDKGRVHVRRLSPLPEAMELLGWGTAAEGQAKAAAHAAAGWGLPVGSHQPSHVD